VDLDAGEVLEAAEGEVELEGLHLDVVAEFEDHRLEGVEAVGEFGVGVVEVLGDRTFDDDRRSVLIDAEGGHIRQCGMSSSRHPVQLRFG
jgi:hypothetical protein